MTRLDRKFIQDPHLLPATTCRSAGRAGDDVGWHAGLVDHPL
jgi:hypothetical protein